MGPDGAGAAEAGQGRVVQDLVETVAAPSRLGAPQERRVGMDDAASPLTAAEAPPRRGWLGPLLRVALVLGAALVAWQIAGNWNRWTGTARFARTDDATM